MAKTKALEETDDMTTPLWEGTVTVTVEVEVGGIPAKNGRQAEKLIKAVAEESLTKVKSMTLWLHKDGTYKTYGRGKPALHIKNPDIMIGCPEGEVDCVGEGDNGPW